jgi:hypothetical protein
MFFVVQCPYCHVRARVPDRALGESGKCTRCANSFTLVPADDQRIPEMAAVAEAVSSAAAKPKAVPVSAVLAGRGAEEVAAHAELMAQFDAPPTDDGRAEPAEDAVTAQQVVGASTGRHACPESVSGAAALFVCGIALVCASVAPICFLMLPLAGMSLAGGITSLVLACRAKKPRFVLPVCGCAACGTLLFVAIIFPPLLGPTYARSRQPNSLPAAMRAIPLAGAPLLRAVPEWTEADKYALQRGDFRIEVVKAWVGPSFGASEEKKDSPPTDFFLVRLRVKRTKLPELVGREASCFEQSDQRRATLVDDAGRSYQLQDLRVVEPDGTNRRSSPVLISMVEEVFVFSPPPASVGFLRLELPIVEESGGGAFRFAIHGATIVRPAEMHEAGK